MLADYLHYLESMTDCPTDWLIIPGHDWPYFGGGNRAAQLIAHHAARLDQLFGMIVTNRKHKRRHDGAVSF